MKQSWSMHNNPTDHIFPAKSGPDKLRMCNRCSNAAREQPPDGFHLKDNLSPSSCGRIFYEIVVGLADPKTQSASLYWLTLGFSFLFFVCLFVWHEIVRTQSTHQTSQLIVEILGDRKHLNR